MDRQEELRLRRLEQLEHLSPQEILYELERFRSYEWIDDQQVERKARHHLKAWKHFHASGKQLTVAELREIARSVKEKSDRIFTCLDPKAVDNITWIFIEGNVVVACRTGYIQTCFPVKDLGLYLTHLWSWIDSRELLP